MKNTIIQATLAAVSLSSLAAQTQIQSVTAGSIGHSWVGDHFDIDGNLISTGNYSATTDGLSFPLFDPSLGVLLDATICVTVTGTTDSMADYYNYDDNANLPDIDVINSQGINFKLSGFDGFLDASYIPLFDQEPAQADQSFTVASEGAPGAWVMSPDDYSTGQLNYSSGQSSGQLDNFIGPGNGSGTFEATVSQAVSYSPNPGNAPGVQGNINTHWEAVDWTATVEIKYEYMVPEPSSMLAALLGLGFLGLRRRR